MVDFDDPPVGAPFISTVTKLNEFAPDDKEHFFCLGSCAVKMDF